MPGPLHIRTPLGRVLGHGAAKSGTEHYLASAAYGGRQRATDHRCDRHSYYAPWPQPGRGGADSGFADELAYDEIAKLKGEIGRRIAIRLLLVRQPNIEPYGRRAGIGCAAVGR